MEFSYIENQPSTYLVHHVGGKLPPKAKINSLLGEIMKSRRACRDAWWRSVQDAGLKNKKVTIRQGWVSPAKPGAFGTILVVTAVYEDPIESMKFNGTIMGKCP